MRTASGQISLLLGGIFRSTNAGETPTASAPPVCNRVRFFPAPTERLWNVASAMQNANKLADEADYETKFFNLFRPGLASSSQMKTLYPALTWEESMGAMLLYVEQLRSKICETYKDGTPPSIANRPRAECCPSDCLGLRTQAFIASSGAEDFLLDGSTISHGCFNQVGQDWGKHMNITHNVFVYNYPWT